MLNKKKIIEQIENQKEDIRKYGVKKIGLFGSFLKKKQTQKSDIDVIVTFDKIQFKKYMELKFMLEKLFRRNVDLVIEKDLKPELKYIKKEAYYVKI